MKRKLLILSCVAFLLVMIQDKGWTDTDSRGVKVRIKDSQGQEVGTYSESYALLVGVSAYTAGWPKLYSVPEEIKQIAEALSDQGFQVTQVVDPDANELKGAFESFIGRYGYSRGNRLVFFFSGHGYSRDKDGMGYLVPTDAPDPQKDSSGFYRQALSMSRIMSWCREMTANHALFLFDSCFSGSVFKARALLEYPPHISALTSRPVRQFISAGDAGEEVPARSVFAPSFLKALRGEADLSGDGYVTGTELGMYLHDKVIYYGTGQTPQYGKIKDPALDEGDFVFFTGAGTTVKAAASEDAQNGSLKVNTEPAGAAKQATFSLDQPKHTGRLSINTNPSDARTQHAGMNRVAVLKFNNQANIPRRTLENLMKVVSKTVQDLLPAERYRIINKGDMFIFLKERGVRLEQPCEGACVIGLGHKIGANYIVTGSIWKAGKNLKATVKFLDTMTGKYIAKETVDAKNIIRLRAASKNAVTQMIKALRTE